MCKDMTRTIRNVGVCSLEFIVRLLRVSGIRRTGQGGGWGPECKGEGMTRDAFSDCTCPKIVPHTPTMDFVVSD